MCNLLKRFRPEDPRRLQAFKARIQVLDWGAQDVVNSLSVLFNAVDDLAEAEVQYYYRRRGTRAWISGLARFAAWLFGSVGLLLPLLAGADSALFKGWSQYGYSFLAAAASCLAANSLFGGTDGHIRFVSTQLNLEKLVTASRVRWCQYLSEPHTTQEEIDKGFNIVLTYATELHTTTIVETGRWGEGLLAELAKYRQLIEARSVSGEGGK
ncbi:SLATT domain-containing protein [Dechloromonas hortensis]|uniref:SLATT domain-containing protein n=1 Tax=Dechloromonas hortensis TaxID=337779 RepID=UPI001290F6B9|nr:SLATT domain-containing protein [Dechloromonas hortensis]